jgi:copper chaperone CopZ
MTVFKFRITNLTCTACIKLSTMALKTIPGVLQVDISLDTGNAELSTSQEINWNQIYSALQSVDKNAVQI